MKRKDPVMTSSIRTLLRRIEKLAHGQARVIVAIAGPPASGKSTLALNLASGLGPKAAVLPMDGFHLDNVELAHLGLLHRKGAPETFDATGFVRLVQRLRREAKVPHPTFDRATDRTIPDGGSIDAHTRVVLIEGNYLLLQNPPWDQLQAQFDLTIGLAVDDEALETRLVMRWLDHGLSPAEARARAQDNDMKNVRFVRQNASAPDIVFTGKT